MALACEPGLFTPFFQEALQINKALGKAPHTTVSASTGAAKRLLSVMRHGR